MDIDDDLVTIPKNFLKINNTCTSSLVNFESRFNFDSRSSTNDNDNENQADLNNNYLINTKSKSCNENVYCICRSSDVKQFMIACDNCNEWFHGDCIGVKQYLASKISTFYCYLCRLENNSLKIKFEARYEDLTLENRENIRFKQQNILRQAKEEELIKSRKENIKLNEINLENSPSRDFYIELLKLNYDPIHLKAAVAVKHQLHNKNVNNDSNKQCLGPNCTNGRQSDSKYCSNDCGLELAKQRMVKIIPERVYEFNKTPTNANLHNKKELERINTEMTKLKQKLVDLNEELANLKKYIKKKKNGKIDHDIEKQRELMYVDIECTTCGFVINEKSAMKHMQKCYSKLEMKSYYGALFEVPNELVSILCNHFNSETKLFCRHLKVICPEHNQKEKISHSELCGCPLFTKENIFKYSNEFCRAARKDCSLHYNWDKTRIANLDIQKLNIYLKLHQLEKEKKQNEDALSQRGNLLSLLLHQTKI